MRAMKDSGIEWIKTIPSSWKTLRGKAILTLMKRSPEGFSEVITCFRDGQVTLRSKRREDGFTFSDKEIGYQGILKGDLVIHGMDGFAGAIGISDSDGKGSPVLVVCNTKECTTYLMYYLRMLATQNVFLALATGIRERSCDLRWNKIADLMFPIPPKEEQRRIASYLDSKCSKIDGIVAKQQQLIEKLKAYKQAVITEAVTKGLNPDVPMKDSGIEWIGDIPERWSIKPLKAVTKFQEGPGIMGADFTNEGVPLIRISGMKGDIVTLDGCNYLDEEKVNRIWDKFRLRLGEVVISASASIGIAALVDENTVGSIPYTGLIRFPINDDILNRFLRYFLLSDAYIEQINVQKTGTTIQHYGPTHLNRVKIALPLIKEQCQIADYIDFKCASIEQSISRRQQLIAKLQEYKKSLIYEVVTGKREVPNV